MRAISMVRTRRTVMDATTSSRASFSLTVFCRISRIAMAGPPVLSRVGLGHEPALPCWPQVRQRKRRKLSMNYTTEFKSIRAEISPEEWQTRVDLPRCYPLGDKYAMTDLIL